MADSGPSRQSASEGAFWARLEYRLCDEFARLPNKHLRFLWCDGIEPEDYNFDRSPAVISGRAWIGNNGCERWSFTLLLPGAPTSADQVDWDQLLPGKGLTCWLSIDRDHRHLEIVPAAAQVAE